MHVQVFQIFTTWFFVFIGTKSSETLFVQIYSKWLDWIYKNIKSAIKFQSIDKKWLFNICLYNVVISGINILSVLSHEYTLALTGGLWFHNIDRSHVQRLVQEAILELCVFCRKEKCLREKLKFSWELFYHFNQISCQMVFST